MQQNKKNAKGDEYFCKALYSYLGINISATRNFHKAVSDLRGKKSILCHQKEHKMQHTN